MENVKVRDLCMELYLLHGEREFDGANVQGWMRLERRRLTEWAYKPPFKPAQITMMRLTQKALKLIKGETECTINN